MSNEVNTKISEAVVIDKIKSTLASLIADNKLNKLNIVVSNALLSLVITSLNKDFEEYKFLSFENINEFSEKIIQSVFLDHATITIQVNNENE